MERDTKLNTERITPELINCIVQKIVREIQPEQIILFGSYAKGDFDNSSDLDLFIIKDDKKLTSSEMRRKVDALLRGRKFSVDLFVRKPSEVEMNISDFMYGTYILRISNPSSDDCETVKIISL